MKMIESTNITGIAHVGIPTNDLEKTKQFYNALGFETTYEVYNETEKEKVAFLQLGDYCIETFENRQAAMREGAYQHVALNVDDVESLFQELKEKNYEVIHDEIQFLPFWTKGVRFFMVKGPNKETIEFCQKL